MCEIKEDTTKIFKAALFWFLELSLPLFAGHWDKIYNKLRRCLKWEKEEFKKEAVELSHNSPGAQ